jgi:hypothetical protein
LHINLDPAGFKCFHRILTQGKKFAKPLGGPPQSGIEAQNPIIEGVGEELCEDEMNVLFVPAKFPDLHYHGHQELQRIGAQIIGTQFNEHFPGRRSWTESMNSGVTRFAQGPTLDFSQEDIVGSRAISVKSEEVIHYLIEKCNIVILALERPLETLLAIDLALRIAYLDQAVGIGVNSVSLSYTNDLSIRVEPCRIQYPQWYAGRREALFYFASSPHEEGIRHTPVPDGKAIAGAVQFKNTCTEEQSCGEYGFELTIYLGDNVTDAIILFAHPVKNLDNRYSSNGSRKTMSGKISEQDVHPSGRFRRNQQ